MHKNAALLERLFASLNRHDYPSMAACYHPAAVFKDIAFDLQGRKRIHAMWAMICDGDSDIRATFDVIRADDQEGQVKLVDEYTFRDTHRPVRNAIDSRFRFRDGLIIEHRDFCDPREWAAMAVGGAGGFLAGRIRLLRSWKAQKKLQAFVKRHPEYQ
jgi:ketosteroid isomerase-like protein